MTFSNLSTDNLAPSSKDLISRKSRQSSRQQNINDIDESQISCPEDIAKCLKFYAQFTNPYIKYPISYSSTSAKTLFKQHQEEFNRLFHAFRMHNIKIKDFVVFFVSDMNKHVGDVQELFSKETFQQYVKHLVELSKTDKICKSIVDTAKFIADDAKSKGIKSFIEYFKHLVSEQLIAQYFMTGRLSPYFLSIVAGFKQVIPKLDHFAKLELSNLQQRFDSYALMSANAVKAKYRRSISGAQFVEYFMINN